MSLFKELCGLLAEGQQLGITVKRVGDGLVVSVMPSVAGVKDKAVDNIVPIVLSGFPEDFDLGFVEALKNGLPKASGLVDNIKEYEESVEMARKATEMAKKEKDEKAKNKKEFDGWIALARQNLLEDKFTDAKICIEKASSVKDSDKSLIEKEKKAIAERSGEGTMFGGPIDKSDRKNITLGKNATVPTPAAKPAETTDAFKEAMELNDSNDENQEEE